MQVQMFSAVIFMHLIYKDQYLCWKSWSVVAVPTETEQSSKVQCVPRTDFVYEWEGRAQELF